MRYLEHKMYDLEMYGVQNSGGSSGEGGAVAAGAAPAAVAEDMERSCVLHGSTSSPAFCKFVALPLAGLVPAAGRPCRAPDSDSVGALLDEFD
jgi:hypothetical protein